jgi:uncharacterized protein YprB with RNaseH-like and TPR domain
MIGRILCCSFKYTCGPQGKHKNEVYTFRGDDKKFRNPKDVVDDSKLVVAIRDELEKADVIVAHNGKLFDRKFLNARLLRCNERPLRPIFFVDPMWIVRSHMRISSKLQNIQQFLKLPDEKTPISWEQWARGSSFDKPAMDEIVYHCEKDVKVLEQAYWRLLPFMREVRKA